MPQENTKIKNEMLLPEKSGAIIGQLLEKYGLQKNQKEGIEQFLKARTAEQRAKIFDNLPGTKLSGLLEEWAEGNFGLKELPELLIKNLAISEKEAKKMTDDLQGQIFSQAQPVEGENAETSSPQPPKPDIYREPIE